MKVNPVAVAFWLTVAGFFLQFSLNKFQNNTIYLYFTCLEQCTLTNATGWVSSTIASAASCVLSIEWSLIEDGFVTGNQLCVTSPVTVFLIVFTLLVTIILHIKNCLDLSVNLYENLPPEEKGMNDLQINALLYDGARVEMDGVVINSWFEDSTSEKNIIELVWDESLRIGGIHRQRHDSI